MSESNDNFVVECSDDESYQNNENNYRLVNGKKVWEPNGPLIASLYRQLESKGFIELRWQCPGRRSPSVHNINLNDRQKTDITDNESNPSDKTNDLLNEFDFESDFNESQTPNIGPKSGPPKRQRQTGLKKSQTNLTKVMADIKKYQFIDQQTKRLSLQTTSQSIPLTNTPSTPEITSEANSSQKTVNLNESTPNACPTVVTTGSPAVTTSHSLVSSRSPINSCDTFAIRSDSPTDIMP